MAYTLIGKNFTPPDIHGKVTGKAKYAEDFRAEGMLYARLLTSPIPHARVRALDVSAALAIEGVVAVLTADDVPAMPMIHRMDYQITSACIRLKSLLTSMSLRTWTGLPSTYRTRKILLVPRASANLSRVAPPPRCSVQSPTRWTGIISIAYR